MARNRARMTQIANLPRTQKQCHLDAHDKHTIVRIMTISYVQDIIGTSKSLLINTSNIMIELTM